jgi:hypothetical protein
MPGTVVGLYCAVVERFDLLVSTRLFPEGAKSCRCATERSRRKAAVELDRELTLAANFVEKLALATIRLGATLRTAVLAYPADGHQSQPKDLRRVSPHSWPRGTLKVPSTPPTSKSREPQHRIRVFQHNWPRAPVRGCAW